MNTRSNFLYYRFKSEKREHIIQFEHTEISIGDIKQHIRTSRGLEKFPEPIELLIFDENADREYENDSIKIVPNKKLIIQRIPLHLRQNQFPKVLRNENFIKMQCEQQHFQESQQQYLELQPSETKIDTSRVPKNNGVASIPNQGLIESNTSTILLEIKEKLSLEIIEKMFLCVHCKKPFSNPVITDCCGDTFCKSCISSKLNCPSCLKKNMKFYSNSRLKEIQEKLNKLFEEQKQDKNPESFKDGVKSVVAGGIPSMISSIHPSLGKMSSIATSDQKSLHRPSEDQPLISLNYQQNQATNISVTNNSTSLNPHSKLFESARFFIIKSNNMDNIDTSIQAGKWSTTLSNQRKLIEAYQQGDVILIFSVNKSGGFQGYAIMTSFIVDSNTSIWNNDGQIKLGGNFQIKWLVSCTLPLSKVKNLTNPLNNNESVANSRDTTELPKETGILLCNLCYDQEKNDSLYTNKPPKFDSESLEIVIDTIKKSKEANINKQNLSRQQQMVRSLGPYPMNSGMIGSAGMYSNPNQMSGMGGMHPGHPGPGGQYYMYGGQNPPYGSGPYPPQYPMAPMGGGYYPPQVYNPHAYPPGNMQGHPSMPMGSNSYMQMPTYHSDGNKNNELVGKKRERSERSVSSSKKSDPDQLRKDLLNKKD